MLSCKNENKSNNETANETTETKGYTETTTVGNNYETFSGMFLYLEADKAAVLQTAGSKIYGVVVNDQMYALNEKCKDYKTAEHTMVPVIVRGEKKPNPVENAWKEVIEIKQIVSVQKPNEGDNGTIIIKSNQ